MSDPSQWNLFSWGANSYGQLGLGHSEDIMLPAKLDLPIDPSSVSSIVGGGGHVIILTCDGKIFSCGWNSKGQLGINSVEPQIHKFCEITLPSSVKIKKLACGWDFSWALSENSEMYCWGSNAYGQLAFGCDKKYLNSPCLNQFFSDLNVIDLAAGLRHVLCLTANGDVFSWGCGRYGELGLKNKDETLISKTHSPNIVSGLSNVKSIHCGSNHSAAFTHDHLLYIWGRNNKGQLGIDPLKIKFSVEPILFQLKNGRFVNIKSGWSHFLGITENKMIYCWGRSDYGQLGKVNKSKDGFCYEPIALENFLAENNDSFDVGSEHNILLKEKKVYTWGWNEHGICGTGNEENVFQPFALECLKGLNPVLVSAGCGISYLLTCNSNS